MNSHERVVVIGGGVVGASVLYHLAKMGWSDVMLLERAELTAGSTWHAAANLHAMHGHAGIARLHGLCADGDHIVLRAYKVPAAAGSSRQHAGNDVFIDEEFFVALCGSCGRWCLSSLARCLG